MSSKLLITFGCSWTYGTGAGYTTGMSNGEYEKIAHNPTINDQLSFRGLLAKEYNLINKNFSYSGSSNAKQLRLAKQFFISDEFKELQLKFDKIFVLWGLTSTARNEMFDVESNALTNFFYHNPNNNLSKLMLKYGYNHDYEVFLLWLEMAHWNEYFKNLNIQNFWFDSINHHNYKKLSPTMESLKEGYMLSAGHDWPSWDEYYNQEFKKELSDNIKQEIFDVVRFKFARVAKHTADRIENLILKDANPRDLLSQLAIIKNVENFDQHYHYSVRENDTNRVEPLIKLGILNPLSYHPTVHGHELLANLFKKEIGHLL